MLIQTATSRVDFLPRLAGPIALFSLFALILATPVVAQCPPGTDVGGQLVREFELDGSFDNSAANHDFSGNPSPVPGDFPDPPPHGLCTDAMGSNSICIEAFTGGNSYTDVGRDTIPKRSPEWGLGGHTVEIFAAGNVSLGTTMTNPADGTWSFTHAALSAGDPVTVEYLAGPSYFHSGPSGSDNRTSVVHTTVGDCSVDFTVANPADHCSADPDLGLACFVRSTSTATDTLIRFGWNEGYPFVVERERPATAGGGSIPNPDPGATPNYDWLGFDADEEYMPPIPAATAVGTRAEIGNVFGVAWDAKRGVFMSSAFFKLDAPLLTDGARTRFGAIYQGNSLWLDLGDPAGLAMTLDRGAVCDFDNNGSANEYCVNDIGFNGLGDLEISDDWNTLFSVNLATQQIVAIPILPDGSPDDANVRLYQAPEPANCSADNPGGFSRTRAPFALGFHEGELYVGVTCTQGIDGNPAGADQLGASPGPHGYVFRFDPSNPPAAPGYVQVAAVDLTYEKTFYTEGYILPATFFGDDGYGGFANYKNWGDQADIVDFFTNASGLTGADGQHDQFPRCGTGNAENFNGSFNQPWLVDLEFDVKPDGTDDVILGVRNRFLDQFEASGCVNGGGVIRLCESAAGSTTWVQETPGTGACGTLAPGTGPGETRADAPFKPNAPQFFMDQGAEGRFTNGALAAIPGFLELAVPGTDNISNQNSSGLSWLSMLDGAHERTSLLLGAMTSVDAGYIKSPTWGDIEAACPAPPLEIGNYVWLDTVTANGIQDADEAAVPGVTVNLYQDANGDGQLQVAERIPGNLIATTTTNGDGQYLFTNADGLVWDTNYVVDIAPSNFDPGGPLDGYTAAMSNVPGTETRDSDGVVQPAGVFGAAVATGAPGQNDHRYDFGFVLQIVGPPPPLSLGNRVWFDEGAGGATRNDGLQSGAEPGVAGVLLELLDETMAPVDLGAGPVTSVTDGSGHYLFDNLPPGRYIVRVAPMNFDAGGPLEDYSSSTPTETSPDDNADTADNGLNGGNLATDGVKSGIITLTPDLEPTGETDVGAQGSGVADDDDSNLTVDFGFILGPAPPPPDVYSVPSLGGIGLLVLVLVLLGLALPRLHAR